MKKILLGLSVIVLASCASNKSQETREPAQTGNVDTFFSTKKATCFPKILYKVNGYTSENADGKKYIQKILIDNEEEIGLVTKLNMMKLFIEGVELQKELKKVLDCSTTSQNTIVKDLDVNGYDVQISSVLHKGKKIKLIEPYVARVPFLGFGFSMSELEKGHLEIWARILKEIDEKIYAQSRAADLVN